jgi:hypothetical protein
MDRKEQADELDRLWEAIPAVLEEDEGWARRETLDAGIAGYTREDDIPAGPMIRHNPDGTRELVQINLDGADIVIRSL